MPQVWPSLLLGFEMTYNIFVNTWLVGYQPELDEIFLYRVDHDGLVWAFHKGLLDVVGFAEFLKPEKFIELGEL